MTFSVWRSLALPVLVPSALAHGGEGAATVVLTFSALQLGARPGTAALVGGMLSLGRLAGSVPAGRAVTRFGDRFVLLGSLGLSAIVWLSALAVRTVPALIVIALIGGLCASGFSIARQAHAIELTPVAHRGRAMAALGGSGRVGLVAGPVLAGLVQSAGGVRAGFAVCVALALIAAIAVALTVEGPTRAQAAAANSDGGSVRRIAAAHSTALLGVGTGVLVLAAARATRPVVVPLAAHTVGIAPGLASILVGAIAAVELILVYPAGIAMDRLGRRWVATPCLIVMGIGLIVLSVAAGPVAVVLGAVVLAAGSGLGSGIVKTLGADLAPEAGRGTFLGVWGVLTEAGGAAGPVGVSGFTALMSFGWGVAIIGAACLGAAVWLDRAVKRHIPARTRQPVRPAA